MQKRVATNNYKWKILSNFLIFLKLIFADNIWYWHVHVCCGGLISFNFYLIHGILFTQTMPSSVTKMEWDSPVMVLRPHMTMHITSQFRGYRYDRKCWVTFWARVRLGTVPARFFGTALHVCCAGLKIGTEPSTCVARVPSLLPTLNISTERLIHWGANPVYTINFLGTAQLIFWYGCRFFLARHGKFWLCKRCMQAGLAPVPGFLAVSSTIPNTSVSAPLLAVPCQLLRKCKHSAVPCQLLRKCKHSAVSCPKRYSVNGAFNRIHWKLHQGSFVMQIMQ